VSLVVKNAFRYPLGAQRTVHDVIRSNAETVTRELVDAAVASLSPDISPRRAERLKSVRNLMEPRMPKNRVCHWTERMAEHGDDEQFLRSYLLDYHKFVESSVSTWPLIDTVMSWSYTWDTQYGYVVFHLPLSVDTDRLIQGLGGVTEPFSYDGRSGETDSETLKASTVARAWERLVGMHSMGYVGATAKLSGYELKESFGA